MDIRHDLEIEMRDVYGMSAEDYAALDAFYDVDDGEGYDEEEYDDAFSHDCDHGDERFEGWTDDEIDMDYDDPYAWDGESADFGLFDEF